MNNDNLKRLNIGAGKTYIPGFVNIDISTNADITLNLSEDPLPFEDSSIDLIFSFHTLEHVPNYLFALSEIYRVLKPNGILLVGVPYVTLTEFNLVNPYHLHNFNEHSFDFFDAKKLKGSAKESNQILFHKVFHRLHYMGKFKSLPKFLRKWCRRHLFNVVKKIDFGLIAVKNDDAIPSEIKAEDLIKDFDQFFKSRTRYKNSKRLN
ncbi:MAG: methyltransferase domain-containing protein [Marinicellaceae bacterium]